MRTLKNLRSCYSGRRGFILQDGADLHPLDLSLISDEILFGVGETLHLFSEPGFKTPFYVVGDGLLGERRLEAIHALQRATRIFSDQLRSWFADGDDVLWVNVHAPDDEYPGFPHFSRNAAEHLWTSGTDVYLCMQLAYHMGLQEIYLIGLDDRAAPPSRLERIRRGYQRALDVFRGDGRSIYAANEGAGLEVFPTVPYHELFQSTGRRPTARRARSVSGPPPPEDGSSVSISAIVCTYRNPKLLEQALQSLTKQTLDPARYEIVVVDNNSNDETPDVVADFPSVRYVFEPEQGLSAARNAGIRATRGEIVAYLDDDAVAVPGWLAAFLGVYEEFPEAVGVGGKVVPIWGGPEPSWMQKSHHRALSLVDWGDEIRRLEWPDRMLGGNSSWRRSVFDRYGLFDTQLGRLGASLLGSEEVVLQRTLLEAGAAIYYTPHATIHHHVPAFRMTKLYTHVRRLATRLDQTILEMMARGHRDQIEEVLEPVRTQAAAGGGFMAQAHAVVEALRRALSILRRNPDREVFEVILMGSPEEREDLRARGSAAVARGDWTQAETNLRAFARQMLVSPEAYLPVIELLILTGNFERAVEEVELARVLNREHPALLRLRGVALHHLSDFEGAREAFLKVLDHEPADVEALLGLGKTELDMALYEAASRTYRAALAADPERCDAWIRLAGACVRLEDQQGADHALERARTLAPQHPELPLALDGRLPLLGPELLAPACGLTPQTVV